MYGYHAHWLTIGTVGTVECNYNQTPYPQFVPVVKQMVPESISSYQHKIGDVITNFVFPSCSSYDENISGVHPRHKKWYKLQ